MTAIRSPIGHEKSAMDGAISIMEIYGLLSSQMRKSSMQEETLSAATPYGVGWANSGGEAAAIHSENSMAVDGIENVIRVLEEIENNRLNDLDFFEGQACTGGCVGGPLTFENGYVAKNTIRKLTERMEHARPEKSVDVSTLNKYPIYNTLPILPSSSMKLDDNIVEAMRKMEKIEQITKELPGYDCGSAGRPPAGRSRRTSRTATRARWTALPAQEPAAGDGPADGRAVGKDAQVKRAGAKKGRSI